MSVSYANNFLQSVATFQASGLGFLQNRCCFASTANTKFLNFQNEVANLGSSVTFTAPFRFTSTQGLVAAWQGIDQRAFTLTCDNSSNVSVSVTNQQEVFNLDADGYMKQIGDGAIAELATRVETSFAANLNSSVSSDPSFGSVVNVNSGPYRFYNGSLSSLSSYQQLAQAIAKFRNYGADATNIKVYLPDMIIPSIVGNGLGQFAPRRNDEIANSWEVGRFGEPPVDYYASNLLPIQTAGTVGSTAQTLTLISTNDPTGQNVTQLTFSGATANDPNAIAMGDVGFFNYGVTAQPNVNFLTFIGHVPSANQVQFRSLTQVAADGSGHVTMTILPALNWAGGSTKNLTTALQAGMQVTMVGSHYAGGVIGGNALYVAMPRLPTERPFDSVSETDPETGVALRLTYGSILGQNQMGLIHSVLWGSFLVPEYSMRYCIPVSQIAGDN